MLHEGLGSVGTVGRVSREARREDAARRVRLFARGLRQVVDRHAAAPARLHAARGGRRAAGAARRDRVPPRHSARPQRRRVDRGAIRRQPSGSPRARSRSDGAALLRRGGRPRRNPQRAHTPTRRPTCARGSRAITPTSMRRSAAGTRPGSIRDSRARSISPRRSPTSACRSWLIQGEADRYGTLAQVRAAEEECYCPVDTLVMPGSATRRTARSRRMPLPPLPPLRTGFSGAGLKRGVNSCARRTCLGNI